MSKHPFADLLGQGHQGWTLQKRFGSWSEVRPLIHPTATDEAGSPMHVETSRQGRRAGVKKPFGIELYQGRRRWIRGQDSAGAALHMNEDQPRTNMNFLVRLERLVFSQGLVEEHGTWMRAPRRSRTLRAQADLICLRRDLWLNSLQMVLANQFGHMANGKGS